MQTIKEIFEQHRSQELAIPMENYMKNHFAFLGIKAPLRGQLLKGFFQESGILKEPFNRNFVLSLWDEEEREYQYAALAYIDKFLKKLPPDELTLVEKLITTKSWWDTVDYLAANPAGRLAKDNPASIEHWIKNENMWLRRSAILFQLKYKELTDEALLYRIILHNSESKEFFIQKAIGWALREYSKTNPDSVRNFLAKNKLPALSVREASKYI